MGSDESKGSSKAKANLFHGQSTASDVFLSYNTEDKPAVEEIARQLLNSGITPWLDKWNLIPGESSQEGIESALAQCASCAVFVGTGGLGPWQNQEVRAAIDRRVRDSSGIFRVIPVFLPGAQKESNQSLPAFLRDPTWVEFRDSLTDEDALRLLVCGIQGKEPGPSQSAIAFRGECPYRGLQSFDISDDRLFFGRDALKSRLISRLRPGEGARQKVRFLGILGPSGSGKSSLARAGLVASVRKGAIESSDQWPIIIFRPGVDPIESLAIAISVVYEPLSDPSKIREFMRNIVDDERTLHLAVRLILRDKAPNCHLLLLVDQFEEIFTLCHDENARKALLDNLLYASSVIEGRCITCVAMRTDFYGKCTVHPALAIALSNSQVLVEAMSSSELRTAIEEPARITGYRFEPGLVDVLLEDAIKEPSALPLLQHALLELWEHRKGNMFTHDAYREMGGLEGALEKRAEKIFGNLPPEEQTYAKRILLRLIEPGQGTDATKRRASWTELESTLTESSILENVIARFTAPDARLVTTQARDTIDGDPTVELSHEALIKSWKRLRDWIEEDRQNLVIQRRLTEAANEWRNSNRDDAYLYRGPLLARATEWAKLYPDEINALEREFLEDSRDESAEQSRLSDAASLDHLELAARDVWLNLAEMERFVSRGRVLIERIEGHRRQLERYNRDGKIDTDEAQRLENEERQFHYDILSLLVTRLERFRAGLMPAAEHVLATIPGLKQGEYDAFAEDWAEAIASIRDHPLYGGMALRRQSGLVPIGQDPASGLWEFAHLLSGSVPKRNQQGKLELEETTAVVLVLLPGGKFRMGATVPTPECPIGSPNTDPDALDHEGPVHSVLLNPFFISKYEMTQGQWLHASGMNPSMFRPDNAVHVTWLHPVECVSWNDCMNTLGRIGLTLPTEVQWEYSARGNTTSIWFIGDDPAALSGRTNLNQAGHTPVGSFDLANAFGLYDVIGNVWEWCRDTFAPYTVADRNGDREIEAEDHSMPGSRGGSFFNDATFARSAIRYFRTVPEAKFNNRGLRPARQVDNNE